MSQIHINLPVLHPAQAVIAAHPARFKVLACGRRFGKTALALDQMSDHLLQGHAVAYFAPADIMSTEVWEAIKTIFRPLISRIVENDKRIELANNGLFECWTARTESMRGRKYHLAVIDEAALIPGADAWNASIRPLLTDFKGHALFASTPQGRNWFWTLFQLGLDTNQTDWASWQFPTTANPFIDPAEVEAARATTPERVFHQEYEASFLADEGSVFRFIHKVCVGDEMPPDPNAQYIFGVDWGRDNDFTCISVMNQHGQQVYLDRFNQISWNVQRDRLSSLAQKYPPLIILAEANSIGSVNIDALQAEGLPVRPFHTTGRSKAPLIESLVLAIERQEIILRRDSVLISELQAYEMGRTASGFWTYSAPIGAHDDTVIATALSWLASRRYKQVNFGFV
jgi:hypothetical protein